MNEIEKKISEGINSAVGKVIEDRCSYYITNPLPLKSEVEAMVKKCSKNNAYISGGFNLYQDLLVW